MKVENNSLNLKGIVYIMKGYWVELFKPRVKADVKDFLQDNVEFVANPPAEKLQEPFCFAWHFS